MKDKGKEVVITPRFGNSTSRIKNILLQEALEGSELERIGETKKDLIL